VRDPFIPPNELFAQFDCLVLKRADFRELRDWDDVHQKKLGTLRQRHADRER
jgi:hypothetical protein